MYGKLLKLKFVIASATKRQSKQIHMYLHRCGTKDAKDI